MEKFEALQATEKQYFLDMVKQCKDSGANLIICQWCAANIPLQCCPGHACVWQFWLELNKLLSCLA